MLLLRFHSRPDFPESKTQGKGEHLVKPAGYHRLGGQMKQLSSIDAITIFSAICSPNEHLTASEILRPGWIGGVLPWE